MEPALTLVLERCRLALESEDPPRAIEQVVLEAVRDPAVVAAIAGRTRFASLEETAIHRSPELTLLAAAIPPGFVAAPHNHNLWSVVGVCAGQEDNHFFERGDEGLRPLGSISVVGPGVLANDAEVIHSIANPLSTPLLVLHAYGGDLFGTPRSHWDPATHEEVPFDWNRVRSE